MLHTRTVQITEKTLHRILFWCALVGVLTFIFASSLLNADTSGSESLGLYDRLCHLLGTLFTWISHAAFRKMAHFTEYAVLGCVLAFAPHLYAMPKRAVFLVSLMGGFAALIDEWLLQSVTEGRAPSFADCGVDFVGSLFGFGLVCLFLMVKSPPKRVL